MRTNTIARMTLTLALACTPALVGGCGSNDLVQGGASVDSRSTPLSAGLLNAVHGTYTSCLTHPDNTTWSVIIGGASTLKVVQGNAACQLAITSIEFGTTPTITYIPNPAGTLALDNSGAYQATAVGFSVGTGSIVFYANAKMAPANYSGPFIITLLHSDDPRVGTAVDNTATTLVNGTVTDSQIDAPTYALNIDLLMVSKDGAGLVIDATGTASSTLVGTMVAGQGYKILLSTCPTTPAAATAAYMSPIIAIIPPALPAPPIVEFGLNAGLQLPVTRCMLIANCDVPGSVCSYETIQMTFN